MQTLKLEGLDGRHLWGFLAALGSFSLLSDYARASEVEPPRLAFEDDGTAVLFSSILEDQLTSILLYRLQSLQLYLEQDLATVEKPSDFTRLSFESIARESKLEALDFLSGLACVVGDEAHESTLCAANGASHQNLVRSMRDILKLVEVEHLDRALFRSWTFSYTVPDEKRKWLGLGTRKPTLRLDPADERLYALRLSNPTTTDDFRTELGAQALAIPAFALLPVVPSMKPVTAASTRSRQRVTFSWPLWSPPATISTVRALLWEGVGVPQLQRERGVFAAFSADRVSGAKGKLSFAPSQGIW